MLKISALIIGDEILNSKTEDLNFKWLTKYLSKTHFTLNECKFVKDDSKQIRNSLKELAKTNEVIFVTGGLGPTKDDITKSTLATLLECNLEENQEAINFVTEQYRKINKEWTPSYNSYHLLPTKAKFLENPKGLAPGMYAQLNDTHLFFMPGVPREFQAMVEQTVWPKLEEIFPKEHGGIEVFNIRTVGIHEEAIFNEVCIGLWEKLSEYGEVSSLPQVMSVDISIKIINDKNLDSKKEKILEIIKSTPLKDHIWQIGNLELPELIVKKACEKGITVSFAESCTGGLTSSMITDISGSSGMFYGSVVAYANEVKMNVLGVKKETLKEFGAVSKETAQEMASGVRQRTNSDISISFTGIAGPGGATEKKPVGTVGIGISSKFTESSDTYQFFGSRLKLKERFATKGLFLLLEEIAKY